MDGFCAETGAALTLIAAIFGGIPVSTTHTITGAIVGVGSIKRLSAVRWGGGDRGLGLGAHDPDDGRAGRGLILLALPKRLECVRSRCRGHAEPLGDVFLKSKDAFFVRSRRLFARCFRGPAGPAASGPCPRAGSS